MPLPPMMSRASRQILRALWALFILASDAATSVIFPASARLPSCMQRRNIVVMSASIFASLSCTSWKEAMGLPNCLSMAASPAPTALRPAHPYPFMVSPQIPSAASFGTSWNGNSPRSQQSAMMGMTSASENSRTRSRTSRSSSVSRPSSPKRSWYKVERASLTDSLWRHPDGTVETYYLAIEHLVLDDVFRQGRVLLRPAKPRRERYLLAKGLLRVLGERRKHRRLEDAGGYRYHPYTARGEFAGYRERERNDAAFRCSVGSLPDLAVVGSDARSVDYHPALAVLTRLVLGQPDGGETDYVEGAHEVYLDCLREKPQVVDALLPDDLGSRADPGAVHGPVQGTEDLHRRVKRVLHALFVRDVGTDKLSAAPDLRGHLLTGLFVDVGEGDVRPVLHEGTGRRRPEARAPTCNKESAVLYLQSFSSLWSTSLPPARRGRRRSLLRRSR